MIYVTLTRRIAFIGKKEENNMAMVPLTVLGHMGYKLYKKESLLFE